MKARIKLFDAIGRKISDHQPVVHDNVLFWNIMMQGKKRGNTGYNNGFGVIESNQQYCFRLIKVAQVVAYLVHQNPGVDVITLCEGPIQPAHQELFKNTLRLFSSMQRFFSRENFSNWGLLMLADKKYQVHNLTTKLVVNTHVAAKLKDRLQLWQLIHQGITHYVALAHFPFGQDEHVSQSLQLSIPGKLYCDLINNLLKQYSEQSFSLCADFNLNPNLISQLNERYLDKIPPNNSVLFTPDRHQSVTVDGILFSTSKKQRYNNSRIHFGLFKRLTLEYQLAKYKENNYEKIIPLKF
jgi:hypothetical protein